MLYIVSGFRRSGTSMMMNALQAGLKHGTVIFRPGMEKFNKEHEGYIPNPNKIWEVGRLYYLNPPFLRQITGEAADPSGVDLIKIFYEALPLLPMGNYQVIYMLRDAEEIQASTDRVERHLVATGVSREFIDFPFSIYRPYKQEDIDHVLGICEMRQDIDMRFVNYRDVIEKPLEVFESLDMPIDPVKCAATIRPELYRFRSKHEHSEDGDEGMGSEGNNPAGEAEAERKAG